MLAKWSTVQKPRKILDCRLWTKVVYKRYMKEKSKVYKLFEKVR